MNERSNHWTIYAWCIIAHQREFRLKKACVTSSKPGISTLLTVGIYTQDAEGFVALQKGWVQRNHALYFHIRLPLELPAEGRPTTPVEVNSLLRKHFML